MEEILPLFKKNITIKPWRQCYSVAEALLYQVSPKEVLADSTVYSEAGTWQAFKDYKPGAQHEARC